MGGTVPSQRKQPGAHHATTEWYPISFNKGSTRTDRRWADHWGVEYTAYPVVEGGVSRLFDETAPDLD